MFTNIKIEFNEFQFSFSEDGICFYVQEFELAVTLEESRRLANLFLEECYSDTEYPCILELSQSAPSGYKENEFCYYVVIRNERDLFKAYRDSYLKDAKNRTQYPLYGFECDRKIIKKDKGYFIDAFTDGKYKNVINSYENWKKEFLEKERIKLENKQKKDKEESELSYMRKLAEKYGYKLTKL